MNQENEFYTINPVTSLLHNYNLSSKSMHQEQFDRSDIVRIS